jgi:hypothetical protein
MPNNNFIGWDSEDIQILKLHNLVINWKQIIFTPYRLQVSWLRRLCLACDAALFNQRMDRRNRSDGWMRLQDGI